MPVLSVSSDVGIAYEVVGEGDPIVLVHGFASSRSMNWKTPGWYRALQDAGRQIIGLDVRGHGESSKPHDRNMYEEGQLALDVVRLLDHLGHERADVMGYSMGGFITLRLLHDHHTRVRRAVIAGVGENYFGRGVMETDAIADGMRAQDASTITGAVPRLFRTFAEQGKNDLEALACCMTRDRHSFAPEEMMHVDTKALLVVGERDNITGPVGRLSQVLRNSTVEVVPGRDHMTTVGDKVYKAAVLTFLGSP